MTKALFHLRQFRLLLLVLLCALFSLPLSAQEAYVEQSKDETTLTFYYDNDRGSRRGEIWGIDKNFSFYGWRIQKVVFEDSFKDYRPTSTARWFAGFKSLVNIVGLENLNTSEVTDMSAMFEGCSSLTSLNLSNFNTSAVTKMRGMFSGCYGLKELNVSNFNTSAVTDMSIMFSRCSSLTSLNLSNFNTSKVTNMSEMFYNCYGLKELNVSNFNTSAVTNMSGMFYNCSRLTELNVSNFNTSAVTDMRKMFSGCSSLKTIFNTDTWRCDNSQNMFYDCTQLKGVVKYDASKLDVTMANPTTGYFTDPNRKVEAYVLQSEDQ